MEEKAVAELEEEKAKEEDGEDSRLTKRDPKEEARVVAELKKKKTNLSALRERIRNGDMFCEEDLFTEIQLVRHPPYPLLVTFNPCFIPI